MSCVNVLKVGLLLGSARTSGNCAGLEKWLLQRLQTSPNMTQETGFEFVNIYPNAPVHPLGPVSDEVIPAMVPADGSYTLDKVNEWSKIVKSCNAFIILTPQYNWGYPGDLKNALDHLYYEWRGKPVMVVTYGGHGGEKCGSQLRQVLSGLRMKVVEDTVSITLPEEYIRTSARLRAEDFETLETNPKFAFLVEAEESLGRAFENLKAAI